MYRVHHPVTTVSADDKLRVPDSVYGPSRCDPSVDVSAFFQQGPTINPNCPCTVCTYWPSPAPPHRYQVVETGIPHGFQADITAMGHCRYDEQPIQNPRVLSTSSSACSDRPRQLQSRKLIRHQITLVKFGVKETGDKIRDGQKTSRNCSVSVGCSLFDS